MSTTVSAVIAQRSAEAGKPSIAYRYAGDRAVLVEYGEMVFDLTSISSCPPSTTLSAKAGPAG